MGAEDGEEGWHPPEGRTGLDLLLRKKKLLVLWMEQNPRSTPPWCLVRLNPGPGPAAISTLGPLSVHGQWTLKQTPSAWRPPQPRDSYSLSHQSLCVAALKKDAAVCRLGVGSVSRPCCCPLCWIQQLQLSLTVCWLAGRCSELRSCLAVGLQAHEEVFDSLTLKGDRTLIQTVLTGS